jgi:GNAT superfamily N-acetyltransferase
MVSSGRVYDLTQLDGFLAEEGGRWLGLVTYAIEAKRCQVVSLDSTAPGQGVGSALLAAVEAVARDRQSPYVWLITTNDNRHALDFYQHRGYRLVAVHRGAVDRARLLKPEIPRVGEGGIAIRDELELAKNLSDRP